MKREVFKKELSYIVDEDIRESLAIMIDKIPDYFDKNISIIIYTESIKEINTKNNERMAFIEGSDEIEKIEVVLFPKLYKTLEKINIGDIFYIRGKVEKRYDKYQISTYEIKKIDI